MDEVGKDFAVNSLLHCEAFKEVTFEHTYHRWFASAILHPFAACSIRNGDTEFHVQPTEIFSRRAAALTAVAFYAIRIKEPNRTRVADK